MDKVYLVEHCSHDDSKLYDIYANLEDAKKRLEELYEKVQKKCDMLNWPDEKFKEGFKYFLVWNKDKTAFDMKCSIGASETYRIKEQKVL